MSAKRLAAALILGLVSNGPASALGICVEGAYPPFSEVLDDGSIVGFDIDIAEALCTRIGESCTLVLTEWERKGYVSENYSSITGTGDDERLSSDRFHSWGALFGIMAFIESGALPAPEAPLAGSP